MAQPETDFVRYIQEEWMWVQKPPITTPTEFARIIGMSRQTVFGWWSGQRPQIVALIKISNVTGIALRKLLELCQYPIPNDLLTK
jgi:transcriptional regulator with XRE-family HTH domain